MTLFSKIYARVMAVIESNELQILNQIAGEGKIHKGLGKAAHNQLFSAAETYRQN